MLGTCPETEISSFASAVVTVISSHFRSKPQKLTKETSIQYSPLLRVRKIDGSTSPGLWTLEELDGTLILGRFYRQAR